MRRFIGCWLIFLFGVLASSAGWASPVLLYQFTTLSYSTNCSPGCSPYGDDYRSSLNQMFIGLEPNALSTGSASLSIQQSVGAPVEIQNDGVASASLALYPGVPRPIALDGSGYPVNNEFSYFDLEMLLSVGSRLTGLVYVNDGSSELALAMSPGALAGLEDPALLLPTTSATEWTGFVRSDALNTGRLFFTGEWRFVRVVPEPGTLALLLAACVGLALVRRTQAKNRRGCRSLQPLQVGNGSEQADQPSAFTTASPISRVLTLVVPGL